MRLRKLHGLKAVHQLPAIRFCRHCQNEQANFYAGTSLGSRCKKCECIRRKELYRTEHPTVKRVHKRPANQSRQAYLAERYAKKKDVLKEIERARRLAYPEKYKQRALLAYTKNVGAWNAKTARYAAAKKKATVSWANQDHITGLYELAQILSRSGVKFEVDHIVPLSSKKVCGLHCEDNLRVIPKYQNVSKGNRYWPDMEW